VTLAAAGALFAAGCGGSSTLTPQPRSIVLPAATARTCVYPSTQAQTVALAPAGGVSGTISVGAFPAASQTCIAITLATGADATANAAASIVRVASGERAQAATPAPAPTPMPLLTISITDAFSYGVVITGMTLNTPSNLNFPDGTYYATISDQTSLGYVFTAKNGTLTLSSTNAQFLVTPLDTATLTLYPRGYVPVFSTSPSASPSASLAPSPSAVPSASAVPSPTPIPTSTPTPKPTPKPTATPVPTATPTPSPTPTATPPSSALLNTGPFTPSFDGFGPLVYTVESVNGGTQSGGNFVVNKSWTENGVAYVETFSITVNALISNPATGTGPNPPTYTYIPATGIGYIQLSDDANYEFSNLSITPAPPFGEGGFDNVGAIYLYFPNDAVASQFQTNFAAYITYLENTLPYIRSDKTR
jgi:hypothetical protein